MCRVLTILEVSQKQAYIFSSNKLRENVMNSAVIASITSSSYVNRCVEDASLYEEEANLVYSGGGHTILEFQTMDAAHEVTGRVTERVLKEFPEIELFACSVAYDELLTPGENVKALTAALEKKKSVRAASFHQRCFGVEKVDVNSGKVLMASKTMPSFELAKEYAPDGFKATYRLEDLGGSDANFVAIVHIDGNAMGKRVEDISAAMANAEWEQYKLAMRAFSQQIAEDFGSAYQMMVDEVADAYKDAKVAEKLSLKGDGDALIFPVRRIITEGDDICFVANGQIGIECAAIFLRKLNALGYAACAGVALVHRKYPFYKAYMLAEELCSHAKKFGADLSIDGTGADVSCIDWHIEYGEMQDSLEETRKQYVADDGHQMVMRPYVVCATNDVMVKETAQERLYSHFAALMKMLSQDDFYGRGLLKGLRPVLKQGEKQTEFYLRFHKVESLLTDVSSKTILFDAIEISDQFLGLEQEDKYEG